MKKLLALLICLSLTFPVYPITQWRNGTGANSILGTENASDIDTVSYTNIVAPLDTMLSNYRQGCKIVYASASTITVEAGEVMLSNSGSTIRLMQQNTSNTTVTWSDIDTGSEATSTTYYLYAYQDTVSTTTFSVAISTSSSAPSGITYYKRLGSFYNDSNGNITRIVNDSFFSELGTWVSRTIGTTYQATTDGFVLANYSSAGSHIIGYTDSASAPTTVRVKDPTDGGNGGGICFPVKAGDYYKVAAGGGTMYFIPLD